MDLRVEIDGFKQWLEQKQLGERSKLLYSFLVKQMLRSLEEISEEAVNTWLVQHPRWNVRSAIRYYLEYKGIAAFKLAEIRPPERKPIEMPTRPELRCLLDKVKPALVAEDRDLWYIYELLYHTGARIWEVLRLRIMDFDFKNNAINFRTKGDKFRVTKIPQQLAAELRRYLEEEKDVLMGDRCFLNRWSQSIAYFMFENTIAKMDLLEKEKRMLLRTHNFRRAIANDILEKTNGDVIAVQVFLGHSSVSTTERYFSELEKSRAKERAYKALGLEG